MPRQQRSQERIQNNIQKVGYSVRNVYIYLETSREERIPLEDFQRGQDLTAMEVFMKKSSILGVVLSLLFLASTPAPAQVTNMRVNYVAPATHPTSLVVQHWVQQVEKRSNGKIKLRVHWAMELSTVMETLQTLGGGAYEIGFNAPGFFPAQFPLASMPSGMMGLTSTVSQAQYYYHEVNNIPAVTAEATANNLKFLYTNAASNYLPISRKPVSKLSDLKGVKVRTFGPYFPKHVRHFGGTAVAIPSVEAYDAFASGVMDVFPSMASDHVVYKFAQVAKNLWELKMGTLPWAVMYMNLGAWNKLPKDMQDVFTQASLDAAPSQPVDLEPGWDPTDDETVATIDYDGLEEPDPDA